MAIQYLGTTISGLASDTKPTLTANEKGAIYVETDTDKIYQWDGDSWNIATAADATTSSKGVASFDSGDFSVSSGAVSLADNITIAGNLTVSGDTITANTANLLIEDPLMVLAKATSGSPANDAGLVIERGSSTNTAMIWDESADEFAFITTSETGGTAGNINMGGYANLQVGTITASSIAGTVSTAAQGSITSLGTLTTLTVDNIIINGTNIGHTSDTDAIAIASDGVVTMNQIPVFSAGINVSGGTIAGTLATAAQTNITSLGTLTSLTGGTGDLIWDTDTLVVDSSADKVGIGTSSPDLPLHIIAGGSGTNSPQNALKLEAITTNTAAAGLGPAIQFEAENASGTAEMVGELIAQYTDVTGGSETSKFTMKTLVSGSSAEVLQITSAYTAFKDGSASAPSITNIGDENTGIYFPAADQVGVSIGGTDKLLLGASSGRTMQWSQHGNNSHYYDPGSGYTGFAITGLDDYKAGFFSRVGATNASYSQNYLRIGRPYSSVTNEGLGGFYWQSNDGYTGVSITVNAEGTQWTTSDRPSKLYITTDTKADSTGGLIVLTTSAVELGTVTGSGSSALNTELRFMEAANYVGFKAPALSANQIWTLPTADGSADQMLKTDGSGTLSWGTASAGTIQLVANGALAAGAPVAVGSDGKAIAISGGFYVQHDEVHNTACSTLNITYDKNVNKVVAWYRNNGSSGRGEVRAGTVASDGGKTWGTAAVFCPGSTNDISPVYHEQAQKHFVMYRSTDDSNNGNGLWISVAADLAISMHNKNDGTADTDNENTNENNSLTLDNGYFGNADYDLNTHATLDLGRRSMQRTGESAVNFDYCFILHSDQTNGTEDSNYGRLCYTLIRTPTDSTAGSIDSRRGGSILDFDAVEHAGACYDPDTDRVIVVWTQRGTRGLRYAILYFDDSGYAGGGTEEMLSCGPAFNSDTYVPNVTGSSEAGDTNDHFGRIRGIYDTTNNKVVFSYIDKNSPYDVHVQAGTVSSAATSGMTITWGLSKPMGGYVNNAGTTVTSAANANHTAIVHDTVNDKIILSGDYKTGKFESYILDYGAGTTFTIENAFDTQSDADEFPADGGNDTIQAGLQQATFDPDNGFVLTIIGNSAGSDSVRVIAQNAANSAAGNSDAFVGVNTNSRTNGQTATITVAGGVNESVSSLTAGTIYYVAATGTLSSSSNDATRTKAGVALAANKLLVMGNTADDS